MSKLLTAKDIAKFFNISLISVYKAAQRNEIPHIRLGAKYLFEESKIKEWVGTRATNQIVK